MCALRAAERALSASILQMIPLDYTDEKAAAIRTVVRREVIGGVFGVVCGKFLL